MKTKTIIIIAVIFITILSILLVVKNMRINNLNDTIQLQSVELSVLSDEVSVYKDKNGELTFKISAVEIEKGNLKQSLGIAGFDIKSLKEKNIKWRNLNNALRLKIESSNKGTAALRDTFYITTNKDSLNISKPDTISAKGFKWTNNYLSLNGNISDSIRFDYKYSTNIDILQTQRKKSTIVSVVLSDPNASIISGNNIIVKPPEQWWNKWWIWGLVGVTTGIVISN